MAVPGLQIDEIADIVGDGDEEGNVQGTEDDDQGENSRAAGVWSNLGNSSCAAILKQIWKKLGGQSFFLHSLSKSYSAILGAMKRERGTIWKEREYIHGLCSRLQHCGG